MVSTSKEGVMRFGDVPGPKPLNAKPAIDDGGAAFPSHEAADSDYRNRISGGGMSLRDYFAAKAMQAIVGNHEAMKEISNKKEGKAIKSIVAEQCYALSDAMLEQRAKGGAA